MYKLCFITIVQLYCAGCLGHLANAGLIIHDHFTLRSDSFVSRLLSWMIPLDVVHKVPLLTIGRVAINTLKLLDTIMYLLVSKKCASPSETFTTGVAREISLSFVNNIDVI